MKKEKNYFQGQIEHKEISDLVSIIIPVYNVENYISQCIDSIINQTYKNLQIIIVNDGATDNTDKICEEYLKKDSRIELYNKKNGGVSSARNYGISKANGKWILFVDSDDWIEKNTIERCMQYLQYGEYDICFIGYKACYSEKEMKQVSNLSNVVTVDIEKEDFQDFQEHILNRDRKICVKREIFKLASACKIYKKDLIIQNNIHFPESINNGEDAVMNLYAYYYAQKGICIEEKLYCYRQHNKSETHKLNMNIENCMDKLFDLEKKFVEITNDKIPYELLYERILWSIGFECILKYCHKDNCEKYIVRKRQFLNRVEKYAYEISNANLKNFGIKKKILFWGIKHKMFLLISVLCYLEKLVNK